MAPRLQIHFFQLIQKDSVDIFTNTKMCKIKQYDSTTWQLILFYF